LLQTGEDIKLSALPQVVTDYIKQHYKGAGIKEAANLSKKRKMKIEHFINYTATHFPAAFVFYVLQ
jgi:hypothetical protein